ncbi:hypothetical protein NECAME_04453 [Necator americanus]|nr:hypothetical protein NECAME_04453 [Necator americanus]ETN72550.1 hypothetical protein NECAME_04453 [Necator americanus]
MVAVFVAALLASLFTEGSADCVDLESLGSVESERLQLHHAVYRLIEAELALKLHKVRNNETIHWENFLDGAGKRIVEHNSSSCVRQVMESLTIELDVTESEEVPSIITPHIFDAVFKLAKVLVKICPISEEMEVLQNLANDSSKNTTDVHGNFRTERTKLVEVMMAISHKFPTRPQCSF